MKKLKGPCFKGGVGNHGAGAMDESGKQHGAPSDAADLRIRAEQRLQELMMVRGRPETAQDALRLLHELEVHQVELEMQNDELVAARAEVEAGLERYTDLYEFAPMSYFTLGRDGTIRQVNITGARLLGLERAKLANLRFGLFVSAADRPGFGAFLDSVFEGEGRKACEVSICLQAQPSASSDGEGQSSWLQVHIDAEAREDGQDCRAAVVDITERKLAEQEHRRLAARIQEAQKLENMGILAGGIAHDLNNLLTAVIGNAQLALQGMSPGTSEHEKIQRAIESAELAAELAEQVLAYSGKGQLVVQPVGLSELVQGTSRLLSATVAKKCTLEYDLGEGLPAVEVDPRPIRRMAVALVLNASEAIAGPAGVISIGTGVMECDQAYLRQCAIGGDAAPGSYVYLEVKDSGCGINAGVQARIFEPFFSTKAFGRGLGLPAVMGIVRSHNGAIHITSKPGGGTAFRVLLPASGAAAEIASAGGPAEPASRARGTGMILVVDDEDDVRNVVRDMLEFAGFTVVTAAGGREAVEVYGRHLSDIDAVLLDLTMPDMDGYETLHELRKMRKDLPILLCSGFSRDSAQDRFGSEDMPGFLAKPFQLDVLIEAVRRLVRGAAQPRMDEACTTQSLTS